MRTVSERLKQRRVKGRSSESVSIRIPTDVIEDLKEIAPTLGFSRYESLIRAYIGKGLPRDQLAVVESPLQLITKSLRGQGVSDEVIAEAMLAAKSRSRSLAKTA